MVVGIKCRNFECEYNKPKTSMRSIRNNTKEKHSGGHCKFGKRKGEITSGKCAIGTLKKLEVNCNWK